MSSKLNTSCPSGFPEFSPAHERVRQDFVRVISGVFERNGFLPITTPIVERTENLLAKGGDAKEMYVFKRLSDDGEDSGSPSKALRFDHTVPLALYVARHFAEISFPFKRYSIGPCFRGERAQKGRYRQFDQCDIDVIGFDKLSFLNDSLMPAIIVQIFDELKIGDFVVKINNRKILLGFFESLGIAPKSAKKTLDAVDDLEKIGSEKVFAELKKDGIEQDAAKKIMDFIEISGDSETVFKKLESVSDNATFVQGVSELKTVFDGLDKMQVPENRVQIDLSIARGLDYYTGTVFETNLVDHPGIGSICSGGRYDDLANVFTGKSLPGVGISIGLSRLLPQLLEAGIVKAERASPSQVLVMSLGEKCLAAALDATKVLQDLGINAEIYLEDKKVGKQFEYANKLGIGFCVVVGEKEIESGMVQVKNMESGEQVSVKQGELGEFFGDLNLPPT